MENDGRAVPRFAVSPSLHYLSLLRRYRQKGGGTWRMANHAARLQRQLTVTL